MIIFLAILLAHLLYDFHWQGQFVADMKGKSPFILCVHAGTWALLLWFTLYLFGASAWWHLPFLLATHALTDNWKARQPRTPETWRFIYVDQAIHLATIIIVCFWR